MKLNLKRKILSYKIASCMHKIKRILFIPVLAMITVFLSLSLSSCCIDYSEFIKSGSEKMEEETVKEIDYTDIKKELADASNYPITPEEEEDFFYNLKKIYDEETYPLVKDYLSNFKILYPSGYFTLIKATQKDPGDYEWFEKGFEIMRYKSEKRGEDAEKAIDEMLEKYKLGGNLKDSIKDLAGKSIIESFDFNQGYSSQIGMIVHEMTHELSMFGRNYFIEDLDLYYSLDYDYLIGNLIVIVKKDKMLFSKYEILEDIENPDDFDKAYHDPDMTVIVEGEEVKVSDIDFTAILDELNAYTVSAKCAVATEEFRPPTSGHSARHGLLKQMSYLELYLKRCYEKYPEDWKYITGNKGLAFLVMKLWLEAEKYGNAVKDDTRFNVDSEPVYEFVYNPDNYWIIEKFFNDSDILAYRDKTFPEAGEELTGIKVYDINS